MTAPEPKATRTPPNTVWAQIEGYPLVRFTHHEDGDSASVVLRCFTKFLGVTKVKGEGDVWAKAWLMIYPDRPLDTPMGHYFRWIPESQRIQVPDPYQYIRDDVGEYRYLMSRKWDGLYYHLYYLGYC